MVCEHSNNDLREASSRHLPPSTALDGLAHNTKASADNGRAANREIFIKVLTPSSLTCPRGRGGGVEGLLKPRFLCLPYIIVSVCSLHRPTDVPGGSESLRIGKTAISLARSNPIQADRVWLTRARTLQLLPPPPRLLTSPTSPLSRFISASDRRKASTGVT